MWNQWRSQWAVATLFVNQLRSVYSRFSSLSRCGLSWPKTWNRCARADLHLEKSAGWGMNRQKNKNKKQTKKNQQQQQNKHQILANKENDTTKLSVRSTCKVLRERAGYVLFWPGTFTLWSTTFSVKRLRSLWKSCVFYEPDACAFCELVTFSVNGLSPTSTRCVLCEPTVFFVKALRLLCSRATFVENWQHFGKCMNQLLL